jgi:predicted nucleotidyltransferase
VSLAACRYPLLAEPYSTALREAVAAIFAEFSPTGVIAAGTIVRGEPLPASDLDVYVLHDAPERQRIQRFFSGVPAEIFVNPPAQVERYLAEEAAEGRPITAHMLSTGFVVYAADESVERLRETGAEIIARGPVIAEQDLLIHRYLAATLFEDAVDVSSRDVETADALLTRAVEEAVRYSFRAARAWQPRTKDVLRRLGEIDARREALVRAYYRAARHPERLELARDLFSAAGIPTGFFEWESAREAVPTSPR